MWQPWVENNLDVLEYGKAQGYTLPNEDTKWALNEYIRDQMDTIASGTSIWENKDKVWIMATTGDSDFACIDIKSPGSYNLTKVNSPTFTSKKGFKSNGTTSYLDTGYQPVVDGTNYTQDSATAIVYVNDNVASGSDFDYGLRPSGSNNNSLRFNARNASDVVVWNINSNNPTQSKSNSNSVGYYCLRRPSSTNDEIIKDASSLGTRAVSSTSLNTSVLFICAFNNGGSASAFSTRTVGTMQLGAATVGSTARRQDDSDQWYKYFNNIQ